MPEATHLTDIDFSAAPQAEVKTGLLGWVACIMNGTLRLDGLGLRRTADGRITLSFPARRDATGLRHFYIRPLDDAVRRDIEHQIFRALGVDEEASRR